MKKIALLLLLFTMVSMGTQAQEKKLSPKEREYLEFLYESMPLNDKIDYDTSYFVKQIRTAMKARETFSWCKNIPENIFKHFVLVYRVNNENLDTARQYMFNELKDRIKAMNMYDAALEVNHWCHEKVNYKASDGRTSSALATLRTSWGRCGEESTFAVTALRSVGIPARQCYTPRWAHTDDNHAWVEVWIDGTWYHLGACEPEAKLNVAWFDAPAKRAMMVHSTVFGKYDGKEERNFEGEKYCKINMLSNYAPTKKLTVKVVDKENKAIENAEVSFGLYNYAEYYPLAKLKTDSKGIVSLSTGYGDLVIWAKTEKYMAQKKAEASCKELTIVLEENNKFQDNTLILTPPKELPIEILDEQLVTENNKRLVYEDSIRNAYIGTFPQTDNKYIKESWGNYKEIQKVLDYNKPIGNKILELIYEKDLRDADFATLKDHIDNTDPKESSEYVINPRIALEKLTAWRGFMKKYFPKGFADGKAVAQWMEKNIVIDDKNNYYGVPISPKGVVESKLSDTKSKEIAFVAICRSFAIQARYEWATGRAQWRKSENSAWQYGFADKKAKEENDCLLIVDNDPANTIKPEYYSQFTIEKLVNNEFRTLDYEYDPHFLKYPDSLQLGEGQYRMIVGNRNQRGKVWAKESYFTLEKGKTKKIVVTIPEVVQDVTYYGSIEFKHKKHVIKESLQDTTTICNMEELSKKNKALIVAVIDPYKEPSRHLLADISKSKADFDKHKDVCLVLVIDKSLLNKDFSTKVFPELPENTICLLDNGKQIQKELLTTMKVEFLNNYPILTLIENNDIVYMSQGYKISSQEELLKCLK